MSEQNYISRQITVYKTDKKLIEFIDKLKPAPTDFYAHIHSFGDKDEEGVKQTSCIGIVLQDYSKGTGKQTVRVMANISPDEAEYILTQLQNKVSNFELKQEKIFGTPDKDGRARVTKLRVIRAETGKDGKKRTYPWYVEIGNGTGVKVKTEKGGFYIKGDSYKEDAKNYLIPIGAYKGKTLGELCVEKPGAINWYVESYHGKNNVLRAGAKLLLAAVEK